VTIIVDLTSGAIFNSTNCYIIDDKSLTEEQKKDLTTGSLPQVTKVAVTTGTPIGDDATEWIKYGWCTSVSYGPSALKDQAELLLETLNPDDIADITTRGLVERFLSSNEAEMAFIGESIMDSDDTWRGYEKNFVDALYNFYNKEPF
jgi:hypothetical protein